GWSSAFWVQAPIAWMECDVRGFAKHSQGEVAGAGNGKRRDNAEFRSCANILVPASVSAALSDYSGCSDCLRLRARKNGVGRVGRRSAGKLYRRKLLHPASAHQALRLATRPDLGAGFPGIDTHMGAGIDAIAYSRLDFFHRV